MSVVSFSLAFSVFGFHIREVRNSCLLPLRREVSGSVQPFLAAHPKLLSSKHSGACQLGIFSVAVFVGNLPELSASRIYFTSLVFIKVSDQCNPGRQPGFISWHYNLKDARISVSH